MPHPAFHVLGFSPPTVKAGSVALHVVGGGRTLDLTFAPGTARDLAQALAEACDCDLRPAALATPPGPKTERRGRGGQITAAKQELYLRAYAEHRTGVHRSLSAACRALGVNQASAYGYLTYHAAALPALCAAHGFPLPARAARAAA